MEEVPKPHVIPYCQFTKLIIYYLGSRHNIHKRPQSTVYITADDYPLDNLKFVSKGGVDEVFRMPIPKYLITDAIQNPEYYKKYMEMAVRKPHQLTNMTGEEVETKKKASKAGKSIQSALAKQPKPAKKTTSKPTPLNKIYKRKRSNHLVNKADKEPQHASELHVEDDEYNLQRGIQTSLESLQVPVGRVVIHEPDPGFIRKLLDVEGKGKDIVSDEQRQTSVTQNESTRPSTQPQDDTSTNVVHDTSSLVDFTNDAETVTDMEQSNNETNTKILNIVEERGGEVSNTVALEERTVELDEGHAGSDPGKTPESRPPLKRKLIEEDQAGSDPRQSHVAQARPNPKPIHEYFIAIVYPEVHESLKLTTEEQVHIENQPSSSGTLSLMKNLEDDFTFGDQFLNDKSIEEELRKANVETKVESMVTIPIHQASLSVPPLSTPIIDLSPHKPVTTDPDLATRVSVLEKRSANFEQKNKLQDKTTQALASKVYKLEHHDLCSKIDKQVNEVVKEVVHNALQAPLRECFRELSEFHIKEILHDRMFESNSYRSHPDHTALYEALEVSMQREKNDELHETLTKSHKRRRDNQDPPLPPTKDSDQSKKKKHDFNADALAKTYKDPEENKLLQKTRDMASFIQWYCKQIGKKKLVKADFEDQIDLMNPEGNWVVHDMRKPLLLGGPPGQITIQAQYFFNKDLDYLVSVPSLWTESESDYDISSAYDISHWWFKRKEFYITRHSSPSDRNAVRLHMNILSVSSLKTYSKYGYTFLKKIFLRRADYKEYKISKADFKNLHLNDFKDMYLLHLQGKLNHLSGANKVHLSTAVNLWTRNIVIRQRVEDLQLAIESYQTKLNITQPRWDATDFLFKEDYTIVHKPRAVIYRDRNNQKKMMRETQVYKFSDGTLTRILE
ncbi:hypothetical protein Tco_0786584 [Tanacetum coccineum]